MGEKSSTGKELERANPREEEKRVDKCRFHRTRLPVLLVLIVFGVKLRDVKEGRVLEG